MSTNDTMITLHGYGIPFSRSVLYGEDEQMQVAPNAFQQMLAGPLPSVTIIWGSHEGPVIGHVSQMWSDSWGLAFTASVDAEHRGKIAQVTQGNAPKDRVSINMLVEDEETKAGVRTIKRASLDHVAIGLTRGAYMSAGVWLPFDDADEAVPYRIRNLAGTWNASYAAYNAAVKRRLAVAATTVSPSSSTELRGPRGPLPTEAARRLTALLNARKPQHVTAQRGFASEVAQLGVGSSSRIYGSAALTREGMLAAMAMMRQKVK